MNLVKVCLQTRPSKQTRLDSVRSLVQELIGSIPCELQRQHAAARLSGVSAFATMLATRFGLDQELAAIAGLLHNFYEYRTGILNFPGSNSAEAVRPLLRDMGLWSTEEQTVILRSIFYQDQTDKPLGTFETILQYARLLHDYFLHTERHVAPQDAARLQEVLQVLGMSVTCSIAEQQPARDKERSVRDKRSALANLAEQLAEPHIVGVRGDKHYRDICNYWPDADIYLTLRNSWCAAFVYHCCHEVGIHLPIRYPNGIYRFAGVGAWLQWAQLPEHNFFHLDGQQGFVPQRGDIVIYDRLLSEETHDHIGIVLGCDDTEIRVAEGNKDNQNVSAVFNRDRHHAILGYVRISDSYVYQFDGEYTPDL